MGVSGGENVTVPLATQPQEVWLDDGTTYTIPNTLSVLSSERWVATSDATGTVAPGATILQTYYHEFLLNVSYLSSGTPSSAPLLTYTMLGNQTHSELIQQNALIANSSGVWVDAGTRFFVSDQLAGDRWFAPSAPDGVASSNMTVAFYHQFQIDASLQVAGGGLPAQTSISGTSGGQPFTELLSTETVGVWLDSGTSYSIPQTLLQLSTERWVAASDLNGTAAAPAAVTQLYYHQALLNLSSSGAPAGSASRNRILLPGREDGGHHWPGGLSGLGGRRDKFHGAERHRRGTGERWYSGLSGGNVTAPVQETARYFQQYLLNYTYTPVGGTMTPPPALALVQAGAPTSSGLTGPSGQFWADAGSHWEASTAPAQPGERWLSGAPTRGPSAVPPRSTSLSPFSSW